VASPDSGIAVALLCGEGEFGDRLRESMASLGTPIVYEATLHALDCDALARSHANVVVVNLDAQNDADLDEVYSLLDDARYRVVFNDDEVSGGLTGWDQARWMRHLAAKILGDSDTDPPRPAGAQAVPTPIAANTASPAPHDDAQSAETGAELAATAAVAVDAGTGAGAAHLAAGGDTGSSFAAPPAEELAGAPVDMSDLDALIDGPHLLSAAPPWSALDDLAMPAARDDAPNTENHAIDAVELSDFDGFALDFNDDASNSFTPPPLPAAADYFAEPDLDVDVLDFDSIAAGTDASAFDFEGGTDLHLDLDLDLSDAASPAEAPAAAPISTAADMAVPGVAFASNEWTLEDVIDDVTALPPVPEGLPAFGIEKLRAEEFLAPDVDANAAHPFEVPQGPSLELIPLEEAVAPTSVEVASRENWLDPDAVQPKVRHVWVLGASIGGPEAVREFLAALPRDYPALFLLAQHLGDEFVDMMAKQLAQATALTVRTPIHGARVGHGEVVVVPNAKRLLVDAQGVVVLERDTEEAAFSPSIDRVLHDAADRFGSHAGAIIFSGMTDDAVEGCRYLAAKGGLVYAQRQDTSVVSTMIDGVCEAGVVSFLGSPQELAEKLLAG
jgi:two-component system chemotaxis response regulator CheB/chemosensory pili system protein ChpB (putative protein-glutamate methylesterase)